jgi:vitamin K-dependent gamma-carboxylase
LLASLNGRKPQLEIDPLVDPEAQPSIVFHRSWIVPLHESAEGPWTVLLNEWENQVDLPNLRLLNPQTHISTTNQ